MTVAPRREISITLARVLGMAFVVVGVAIAIAFGLGAADSGSTTFVLNEARGNAVSLSDLVVPSAATAWIVGAICPFLGGYLLTRGFGRRTSRSEHHGSRAASSRSTVVISICGA